MRLQFLSCREQEQYQDERVLIEDEEVGFIQVGLSFSHLPSNACFCEPQSVWSFDADVRQSLCLSDSDISERV